MEKIFTYGTLQDESIQQHVIGRTLGEGTTDTVRGYRMGKLKGIHTMYNIIYPQSGSTVEGKVYDVSPEELEKIDAYEGDAYMRVSVTLISNTRAWTYCANPSSVYHNRIEKTDE